MKEEANIYKLLRTVVKLGDYFTGKKRLIQKDVVDGRILQYTLYRLGSQFFKCAIGSCIIYIHA